MPKAAGPLPALSLRPHPHLLELPAWTWLHELSLRYGKPLRLGQVPDDQWNRLKALGFDLIWLMGVWKRSPQSRRVFRTDPNRFPGYDKALPDWRFTDIVGSPYAVMDYRPDPRIGGWRDIDRARTKLRERGMGLILDFVPNHTAPDHPWVRSHSEFFVEGSAKDYRRDTASFFLQEQPDETVRFVAYGRDPYFPSWPDTAQLNHFHPQARAALLDVIQLLAQHADGLRCDMAMLALNDIFGHTWASLQPGAVPPTEFWQEAIAAAPHLVWLAEAYWGTESRLQQLGFSFTYDKPFCDSLRKGSAGELRARLAEDGCFQKRSARFLENHDEERAAAVFGQNRMQAAATLASTAPGMRFYFHGQLEGFQVRLPVELGRAPEEAGSSAVREIYRHLLPIVQDDVFHSGNWNLLAAEPAGDSGNQNLIVYEWKSESTWKLVAANPTPAAAQGRVALGDALDPSARYLLSDQLNSAEYPRSGEELASGLFIRLEAGRAHVFDIRRA